MAWSDYEKALLALVAWREARGEGEEGMRAVMHVCWNRHKASQTPLSNLIVKKWQFSSMTAPGDGELVIWPTYPDPVFEKCLVMAEEVIGGVSVDPTGGAQYYANLAVVPANSSFWMTVANNPAHPKTVVLGHHTFYK